MLNVLLSLAILIPVAACGGASLDTPANLSVNDELVLSWGAVQGARSYRLEIVNTESNEATENTVLRTSYSLTGLAEGDYELRLRAVGGSKNNIFSAWSEPYEFHRDKESGLLYVLVNGNTAYEVKSVGTASGNLTVESVYRGKPVVGIGEAAFRGNTKIESVVIPEGVTYLGASAFYNCANLTSVSIPDSVASIGSAAFQQCSNLLEVNIPAAVTAIAPYTFAYCRKLVSITLPETITEIGASAFTNAGLDELVLPDSVVTIAESAFRQATALRKVTFGSGIETVGYTAFYNCITLKDLVFAERYEGLSLGSSAFGADTALVRVDLPDGTVGIGSSCFAGDTALAEITIPESVTSVAQYAFASTKLYNDQLEGDGLIYADHWVLGATDEWKTSVTEITASTFRENTFGIADRAFVYVHEVEAKDEEGNTIVDNEGNPKMVPENISCENLKRITFPGSLKYVGALAFYHAPQLNRILALSENSLKRIGEYAFAECPLLSTIRFAEGLEEIGKRAFYNCASFQYDNTRNPEQITPVSLMRIGENAFFGTMQWSKNDDENAVKDGVVYVGNWVVGYHIDPTFEDESIPAFVELREETVGICDYAFYADTVLQSIGGLENVTKLGKGAFAYCTSLLGANLSRNLTSIRDYTFYNCKALYTVSFQTMLQSIGTAAFYRCERLREVDLGGKELVSIGDYAFRECNRMRKLTLGNKLESIGKYAFYGCSMLEETAIPDSVTEMGDRVFADCVSLNSIKFGSGLKAIGNYAFYGCKWLRKLEIPDGIISIGDRAFCGCTRLFSVKLGAGVKSIGDLAFGDDTSLIQVVIPAGVERIGSYAFMRCDSLKSVLLAGTPTVIGENAFYGCDLLTVYGTGEGEGADWSAMWDPSQRPAVWGVELAEDAESGAVYVASVTAGAITHPHARFGISGPERAGYTFVGWSRTEGATATDYTASQLEVLPDGTKVYSVFEEAPEEDDESWREEYKKWLDQLLQFLQNMSGEASDAGQ